MSEQQPSTTQGSPRRSRRWIVAGSILGSIALLGGAMAFAHVRDGGGHSGWGGPTAAGRWQPICRSLAHQRTIAIAISPKIAAPAMTTGIDNLWFQ
jgi:hypothetical protein